MTLSGSGKAQILIFLNNSKKALLFLENIGRIVFNGTFLVGWLNIIIE